MFSRRLTCICVTALALSAAVSCSRGQTLLGRWVDTGAPTLHITESGCAMVSNVEFFSDGSFFTSSGHGKYALKANSRVEFNYPNRQLTWEYHMSGDTLILKGGLIGAVCRFTRAK